MKRPDAAGTSRKPRKPCRLTVVCVRRAFPCRLRRSLFPTRSFFQLFPKREGFGQTAMCSHPGMEIQGGELAERGSERRSVGTAPEAAGAGRALQRGRGQGHGRAAAPRRRPSRVLVPASSRDETLLLGGRGVSPQVEERDDSVPRRRCQRSSTSLVLFHAWDLSLLCHSVCPVRPHTSSKPGSPCAAGAARSAPHRAGRARPGGGCQAGSGGARYTQGTERTSPRLLMDGNF